MTASPAVPFAHISSHFVLENTNSTLLAPCYWIECADSFIFTEVFLYFCFFFLFIYKHILTCLFCNQPPLVPSPHNQQFCSENPNVMNAFANEVVHSANGTIINSEALLGVRKQLSLYGSIFYSSNGTCMKRVR